MSRYAYTVAAALILALLTATHWKVYHLGWTLKQAEYNQAVAAATERYRAREATLSKRVEELDHALQKQKARNAATDRAHAERLREYQAALDRASQNPAAPGGTTGPFAQIAGECGRALVEMDQYARGLAATAGALQGYASKVCLGSQDTR